MTTAVNLSGIRFSPASSARRIAQSPVLLDLLDQAKLTALVADVTRASDLASEAGKLAAQGATDLTGMIDAVIRAGDDATKLVDKIVKARAATAARKDASALLSNAADRYRDVLEHWLDDQAFDLIDVLAEKLEDLLDRAEEVTDALDGVSNADDAIDAGLAAEWGQLRKLHQEYISIREAQVALLRATAPGKFGGETSTLAFAFFASPTRAWPHLGAAHHGHVRTGGLDAHGVPASPFDLNDPSDAGHWLAAVTRRAELGTRVVDAEHALTEHTRIIKEALPREPNGYDAGGELVEGYGSEAAVARRYIGAR